MNKINKVVVPIAGFGSRMFPATLGVTKAMLPLVDRPVIEYIIQECIDADIHEIIIVMSENQSSVKEYLNLENEKALEKFKDKKEVKELKALLSQVKISYVIQHEQKGLGHAILCAKELVNGEDFGCILGDNPILGDVPYGVGQLYNAYKENKGYYIGVIEVPLEDTKKYGVVKGIDYSKDSFRLTDMIEKPQSNPPSLYGALGRYILGNSIFDYIEHTEAGVGGEIQVTDAIVKAIKNETVYATKLTGHIHDTGNRLGFVKANIDYALKRDDIKEEVLKAIQEYTK